MPGFGAAPLVPLSLALLAVAGCGGDGGASSAGGSTDDGGAATGGPTEAPTTGTATNETSASDPTTTGSGSESTTGSSGDSESTTTGSSGSSESTATSTDGTSTETGTTTEGAETPRCGDGLVEAPEMCEPGEPDCLADCTYPPGLVFWTDIIAGVSPGAGARAWGVAFDADDVPLAAMSRGGMLAEGAGAYIKQYTREGGEVWSERWTSDEWPIVNPLALTVQPDGSPVLAGQVHDAVTGNDGFLGQMTPDGTVGWGRQFALEHNDWLEDALGLPDGSVVAVGTRNQDPMLDDRGWIVKVSAAGVEDWREELDAPMNGSGLAEVAALPDGRLVTFGCCLAGGEFLLRTYELDGAIAWTAALPALDPLSIKLSGMTVDPLGDIVVIWRTKDAVWLGKYTDTGDALWTKTLADPDLQAVWPKALVATPQGRYVFGGRKNGANLDIIYGAFDASGELLWTEVVAGSGNAHDQIEDLAVDSRGVVLAGGLLHDGEHRAWVRMFAP